MLLDEHYPTDDQLPVQNSLQIISGDCFDSRPKQTVIQSECMTRSR